MFKTFSLTVLVLLALSFTTQTAQGQSWRTADRSSFGLAPKPEDEPQALVQVYAARTVSWRGYFAVHSWMAIKEKDAKEYTTFHVMGWRLRRGESVVVVDQDIPDRRWYGAEPELLVELKGEKAEAAIPKIRAAAESYPYPDAYRAWPGPNSNTFVSHILRNTPEIGIELPPHAIGKDWINNGHVVAKTESGTGYQFSVLGVLGASVGVNEGLEVNILGLSFGLDFLRPAIKLPLIGRIGVKDSPVFD